MAYYGHVKTYRDDEVMKNMMNLEAKKEQEIKNMVTILEQIDLPDIILLTRDANTLLMRQKEAEAQEKWNPKKEYEKIMSTTEIGDTVVLIEKEKNMYKRTRNGLKLIDSEVMEVIRKEDHHQFRL